MTAWKMWIADERKFQEANLAEIRKYPVTKPQRLSPKSLGSVSRAYYDSKDNVMYAGIRYPAHMASVAAIHLDTGNIEELKDIKGPALYYVTSLAWDARGRKLYYTTDNNDWRDLNRLRRRYPPLRALAEGFPHRRSGLRFRGWLALGRSSRQRFIARWWRFPRRTANSRRAMHSTTVSISSTSMFRRTANT